MIAKNLRALWVETSPDKALARARRFIEKGRLDSAAETLKGAIDAEGEDPILRIELSQVLVTAGRTREAADGLRGFLKSYPDEYRRVCDFVDWARANHHESQPLHEILGEHHVGRREFGAALDALERVDKKGLQTLLDARLANLQRFVDKSPGSLPKSAVPLLYFAALIHEALHDYPKALDTYRRILAASRTEVNSVEERLKGIIARNHRSVPLRAALAEIYLGAGEQARALEEYVQMVEVDPQSAAQAATALQGIADAGGDPSAALWALARVHRRAGKTEELLRAAGRLIGFGNHLEDLLRLFEGAIADGAEDPRLHLLIGESALKGGKISRATTAFMTAAMHPSVDIQARSREGLERILEEHPAETRVLEALADQRLRDGSFDACVGLLDRLAACGGPSIGVAVARLQTVLLGRPGLACAESLLEKLAPVSGNSGLAAAFLRRKIRLGPDEALKAAGALTALLAAEPGSYEIRVATAEALYAAGDPVAAWDTLRPAVDGTMGPDPSLFHLLVLVGGASPDLSRSVSEVFRTMAPALAATPEGHFARAEMAARSGNLPGALEAFRAAATFSAEAAGEVIAAVRSLGSGGLLGEAAVSLSEALLDAGDFAGAASVISGATELPASASRLLTRLETALTAAPDDIHLRVAIAGVLAGSGRASRGREVLEEGIRRAGESAPPALYFAQGDAWLADGNLTESVRAYSRALARDKSTASEAARRLERVLATDVGHPSAHLSLGRALLLDGRPREGVNALLTAWSIRPSLGGAILKDLAYAARAFPLEPQVDLARSQILLGQGEVEEASSALGSALRTAPSIAAEVLVRLESVMSSHPSCARAYLHAAQAWLARGRCRESSESFSAAAEHDIKLAEPAAAGLASVMRAFPERPEPHLARARIYAMEENGLSAAQALRAAAARGADASTTLPALRKIAAAAGPQRGRALLSLAAAAGELNDPIGAAEALETAVRVAPEILDAAREEVEALEALHPSSGDVIRAASRLALTAQRPAEAILKAERLLEIVPSSWRDVAAVAADAARAGEDEIRCGALRARALVAGGEYGEAAQEIDRWMSRSEGKLRSSMCLLRARIEKRCGKPADAKKWITEAETLASDRESFLSELHSDAILAAKVALSRVESVSDRWRALRACLDIGDADSAEKFAAELNLASGEGEVPNACEMAAAEVRARIACLRGRFAEGAEILSTEPPSALKASALRRAGRLVEAAACVFQISPRGGEPSITVRDIYLELAAAEFLGALGSLEAETTLQFPLGPQGEGR